MKNNEKRCTSCQMVLPRTLDHFHKSASCKDGLVSSCKDCKNSQARRVNKSIRSRKRRGRENGEVSYDPSSSWLNGSYEVYC